MTFDMFMDMYQNAVTNALGPFWHSTADSVGGWLISIGRFDLAVQWRNYIASSGMVPGY